MSQPIIKRARVQLAQAGPLSNSAPIQLVPSSGPVDNHGHKTVQLLEEAGRIHAIELTCTCGDVTAIELIYPGDEA